MLVFLLIIIKYLALGSLGCEVIAGWWGVKGTEGFRNWFRNLLLQCFYFLFFCLLVLLDGGRYFCHRQKMAQGCGRSSRPMFSVLGSLSIVLSGD
jgi:hypothetical protein